MAWTKVITTAGQELIAQALGGDINYTRVACGSLTVPIDELVNQTNVSGEFRAGSITGPIASGKVSKLTVQINNIGLEQDTPLAQVGIFASVDGGAEALMLIMQNDTPSNLPALEVSQLTPETTVTTIEFFIGIQIDSAANVTVTLDLSAYVTVGQLQDILANFSSGDIILTDSDTVPPNTRLFLHIGKDITGVYTPPDWSGGGGAPDPGDDGGITAAVFNEGGQLYDGIGQEEDGEITPLQFSGE